MLFRSMEWMAKEEIRLAKWNEIMDLYYKNFKNSFQEINFDDWENEKNKMMKNSDPFKLDRKVIVDWSE